MPWPKFVWSSAFQLFFSLSFSLQFLFFVVLLIENLMPDWPNHRSHFGVNFPIFTQIEFDRFSAIFGRLIDLARAALKCWLLCLVIVQYYTRHRTPTHTHIHARTVGSSCAQLPVRPLTWPHTHTHTHILTNCPLCPVVSLDGLLVNWSTGFPLPLFFFTAVHILCKISQATDALGN